MRRIKAAGGWPAIFYTLKHARATGGFLRMWKAMRTRNACKTCALGMGGQQGGMVNEAGRFPEVCKKSVQAMAADLQGAVPTHFFDDVSIRRMQEMTPRELEAAGRLTRPVYRGPLDSHYREIDWDDALDRIASRLGSIAPEEAFFYFSGRSSNEAGFLLQLMARCWGTNNINNCSYYCHQASGVGLASVTGSGTATVVLEDLHECDLVVLIGANPSSNHPRLMRSLVEVRRRGGRVVVINPLRELGLDRFKVPSDVRSMIRASRINDLYVQGHIGGDGWLLAGVIRALVRRGGIDRAFVGQHADGWDEFEASIGALDPGEIVRRSGVEQSVIDELASLCAASKRSIFCWAMGITHHDHGVGNVQMIANLAIATGQLGRPGCGLLPLRGHSNVQGIGSMGVVPKLKEAFFRELEHAANVPMPTAPGMDTLACMEAARSGAVRFALCLGGNLYGSNPDSTFAAEAFRCIDQVVHLSTTLNTGHAHGCGRETIILPVLPRDEESQSTTQESMFNYVRLSDGGRPRHEGPRSEVDVITDLASRILGDDGAFDWTALRSHDAIRSLIARVVPGYEAIEEIGRTGEEFHIDGRTFHTPRFSTETGRARVHNVPLPHSEALADDELRLMTIRSEGQFNTVVYEEEDLYRGQDRRDVILMHADDMDRFGLVHDERVEVSTGTGSMEVHVRAIDIRPGNAVMYYPEANVLIPRRVDPVSRTPAFKGIPVRIRRRSVVAS